MKRKRNRCPHRLDGVTLRADRTEDGNAIKVSAIGVCRNCQREVTVHVDIPQEMLGYALDERPRIMRHAGAVLLGFLLGQTQKGIEVEQVLP